MKVPDPLQTDNPAYAAERMLVEKQFDEHWEKQHIVKEPVPASTGSSKNLILHKAERLLSSWSEKFHK